MKSGTKKTVIILGAGFSTGANLPVQNKLLAELESFGQRSNENEVKELFRVYSDFFIHSIGGNSKSYLIEDLFTIFDNCLISDESFRGEPLDKIQQINRSVLELLRLFLINRVDESFAKRAKSYKYYGKLANEILKARDSYKTNDRLSIISLNWDHYFEKVLTSKLPNHTKIALDYCTYDYTYSNNKKDKPSITKKAYGKRNLKIMKPHGSANWGYCPNCGRLYISYGKKIESRFECNKYCKKVYPSFGLTPVLITPTFLKELSIRPLKDIWNNIGIELSESNQIVFIGYSLRPEDYLFRYMLAKHTNDKAGIVVIDKECNDALKDKRKKEITEKFENFFQKCPRVEVSVDGWEESIPEIIKQLP